MNYFLEQMKEAWKPILDVPAYFWSYLSFLIYFIPEGFIKINREFVKTIVHLITHPESLLVVVLSIPCALFVVESVPRADLFETLSIVSSIIVSLVSVLIAAAIFISTLQRRNQSKTDEADVEFKNSLDEYQFTIAGVYDYLNHRLKLRDKITIFKASPADNVMNSHDFQKYKEWHKKAIRTMDSDRLSYHDMYIKYAGATVRHMLGWRSFLITDATEVAIRKLSKPKNSTERKMLNDLLRLTKAAENHQTAGVHGYYVPKHFIGGHLIRVTFYCLIALITIMICQVTAGYSEDFFPGVNLHTNYYLLVLAIVFSVISLYLLLRQIFGFLFYLRDSANYEGSLIDNVYIEDAEDDEGFDRYYG